MCDYKFLNDNTICILFFNRFPFFYYFYFIYLFLSVLGLCFCARAFSSCGKRGPLFIAVCGPLTVAASLVVEHRLQMHRLSSCGSLAQLLRGTWDLPRPGLVPVSPALAGRFSTTVPPGKPPFSFLKKFIYLFYFCLHSVFVATRGLCLVAVSGGYSLLRCAGFSLQWLLLLRSTGSRRVGFSSCGSRPLEHRLSSCGTRASLLRGM